MKTKYIILILLIFFIASCCKENYYSVPEKDKYKMQFLDTMIYNSNLSDIDTMYIHYFFDKFIPENEVYPSCRENDSYEELTIVYYIIKQGVVSHYISIMQEVTDKGIETSIRHSGNSFELVKKHRKYTINGTKYKQVWEYSCNSDIVKLYTNLEYGILSYEKDTGETFYLDKYIHAE